MTMLMRNRIWNHSTPITTRIVFLGLFACAAQAEPASIELVLNDALVVRASVSRIIEKPRGSVRTEQTVEYVYCGIGIKPGDTFVDTSRGEGGGGSFGQAFVTPSLEVGQRGIWLLRRSNGSVIRMGYSEYGVWWPVRPGITRLGSPVRYEGAEQLAQAMESIWHAESEPERLEMVKRCARSEVPEVVVGAIMLLAEGAPDALRELAAGDAVRFLAIHSQLALDEAMIKTDREGWVKSDHREAMLKSWAVPSTDADRTREIVEYLALAVQRHDIEPQRFVDLTLPLIANEAVLLHTRQFLMGSLQYVVNTPEVHDRVVTLLLDTLENATNDLAPWALKGFDRVERLTPDQLTRVIVLRDAAVAKAAETPSKSDPIHRQAQILTDAVKRATKSPQIDPAPAP